jgi:hypothetical protein
LTLLILNVAIFMKFRMTMHSSCASTALSDQSRAGGPNRSAAGAVIAWRTVYTVVARRLDDADQVVLSRVGDRHGKLLIE